MQDFVLSVPVLKENELLNHVCIMGEKIGSFPSSCPYGYLSGYIGPVIHSVICPVICLVIQLSGASQSYITRLSDGGL